MEPARIPNDREHEFSIELSAVLFWELFHLVAARRFHNPYSGKTKTHRGWRCHAKLNRPGLQAFAIVAGTN
jgi:hypothetical protein